MFRPIYLDRMFLKGGKSNAVLMGIVHRLNDTASEEFENEQTSATIDCDAGM